MPAADDPGRRPVFRDVPVPSEVPTTRPTPVARLMQSRAALSLMSTIPVPLLLVRAVLLRDNARENARDSWNRLRHRQEQERYTVVRDMVQRYAADGFVLDVGCSQGILQEGLAYRRYLGVDSFARAIDRAQIKTDRQTAFRCADATTFVADEAPDAVVFNEVLYYLPDPVGTALHYAAQLGPGGVLVVSIYARSWASRRLLRQLGRRMQQVESRLAASGQLAWSVVAYRPRR